MFDFFNPVLGKIRWVPVIVTIIVIALVFSAYTAIDAVAAGPTAVTARYPAPNPPDGDHNGVPDGIPKSAMKAASIDIAEDACHDKATQLFHYYGGRTTFKCDYLWAGHCRRNVLNKWWGSCHMEAHVRSDGGRLFVGTAKSKWVLNYNGDFWEISLRSTPKWHWDDQTQG